MGEFITLPFFYYANGGEILEINIQMMIKEELGEYFQNEDKEIRTLVENAYRYIHFLEKEFVDVQETLKQIDHSIQMNFEISRKIIYNKMIQVGKDAIEVYKKSELFINSLNSILERQIVMTLVEPNGTIHYLDTTKNKEILNKLYKATQSGRLSLSYRGQNRLQQVESLSNKVLQEKLKDSEEDHKNIFKIAQYRFRRNNNSKNEYAFKFPKTFWWKIGQNPNTYDHSITTSEARIAQAYVAAVTGTKRLMVNEDDVLKQAPDDYTLYAKKNEKDISSPDDIINEALKIFAKLLQSQGENTAGAFQGDIFDSGVFLNGEHIEFAVKYGRKYRTETIGPSYYLALQIIDWYKKEGKISQKQDLKVYINENSAKWEKESKKALNSTINEVLEQVIPKKV